MKFGYLIKYTIRNILVEKPYTKYSRETNPRPFSKKSKLKIYLGINSLNVLWSLLLLYAKLKVIEIH